MLNILFYFFSIVLLFSSLLVVVGYNSIISVLFLILSFLVSAILLLLLECEFLSLILVTVYVGAVAVLFIFVLMMLETKLTNLNKNFLLYFPFGFFINCLFFFEIITSMSNNFSSNPYSLNSNFLYMNYCIWYAKLDMLTEVEVFGQILYTHFVLQFLIVGFILFLALVGVVYLVSNSTNRSLKTQTVFHQLSRNSVIF